MGGLATLLKAEEVASLSQSDLEHLGALMDSVLASSPEIQKQLRARMQNHIEQLTRRKK